MAQTNKIRTGQIDLSVKRQNNTTNSDITGVRIETGWGFKQFDGTNDFISEAVTFSQAFTQTPIIIISPSGLKNSSDPSAVGDAISVKELYVSTGPASTTGFTMNMRYDGSVLANTYRGLYSWIAIGN